MPMMELISTVMTSPPAQPAGASPLTVQRIKSILA